MTTQIHTSELKVSVLIPTHFRPSELRRCLTALTRQTYRPSEIIVIHQSTDAAAHSIASEMGARVFSIEQASVIRALTLGFSVATEDLVAVFDDDTEPNPEWISQCISYFHDKDVGAVGGKDDIPLSLSGPQKISELVGKFTASGRIVGNHHVGFGNAREVHFLKGCNFMIRTDVARSPAPVLSKMLGVGAEVGNDLVWTASAMLSGLKVIYDPSIRVNHFPAARMAGDDRESNDLHTLARQARNSWLIRVALTPSPYLFASIIRGLFVGDARVPGLIYMLAAIPMMRPAIVKRWFVATWTFPTALRDGLRSRTPVPTSVAATMAADPSSMV